MVRGPTLMFSIWPIDIWTALTKHNRLNKAHNRLISHSSETGIFKIKVPGRFYFWWEPSTCRWWAAGCFSTSSHLVEGGNSPLSSFSYKDTIPTCSPPSWPHLNLLAYQRPPPPILLHWVIGLQHLNVRRGHENSVRNTKVGRLLWLG